MKKIKMEPVTQVTEDKFLDPLIIAVAELGTAQLLSDDEARGHIDAFDQAHKARMTHAATLGEYGRALMRHQQRWKGKRRYHVYICFGCGDPLLVSSGPRFKPHEWVWETDAKKSTLSGGCAVCEQPMTTSDGKPQRRGGTLRWARYLVEVRPSG